ncbi:hypothetical protein QBC47DRAFT_449637 [Echria macrotheca]|uniref:SnoaL-like domain-containing protein n=1 Tax=Echria macrotheca TaxID=438768 RepID=A0AAJ0BIP0_9PEZI|nr:hypothetical protein QBC47DRAFT_449637 [Echria macrotheca]
MTANAPAAVTDHLKNLYSQYRNTGPIDDRAVFFSPECMQICKPNPSYAATNRNTIVRYLHEAAKDMDAVAASKGLYTIRPLRQDETTFETDEVVAPTGMTSSMLRQRAIAEEWVGMRVDLWWPGDEGLLVKVQYWWRREGKEWVQILHDIMYMGPCDGTEGKDGDVLE